jgi:hypothetical protein
MKRSLFALFLLALTSLAVPAFAEDSAPTARTPGTLGCFGTSDTCARVILPAGIGGLNLKTNSVQAGAFPAGGVGLAIDFFSKSWYQTSPGIAVTASAASGDMNYANVAAIVGVFRYFFVGTMVHISPSFSQWYLLGGVDPMAVVGAIGSP